MEAREMGSVCQCLFSYIHILSNRDTTLASAQLDQALI